jgi:hypothetical protein
MYVDVCGTAARCAYVQRLIAACQVQPSAIKTSRTVPTKSYHPHRFDCPGGWAAPRAGHSIELYGELFMSLQSGCANSQQYNCLTHIFCK